MTFGTNCLHLQAHNPEQEEAQEDIEFEYQGDEVTIGFNAAYLVDVLNVLKCEKVVIDFSDGNNSVVIRANENKDRIYVIMPMRL